MNSMTKEEARKIRQLLNLLADRVGQALEDDDTDGHDAIRVMVSDIPLTDSNRYKLAKLVQQTGQPERKPNEQKRNAAAEYAPGADAG